MAKPKGEKIKSGVVIASCTCKSPYQDQKYNGNRVFNRKGGNEGRCTVCSKTKVV